MSVRVLPGKPGERGTVLFLRRENVASEVDAEIKELGTLLGLEPGRGEYRVAYGSVNVNGQEIAILTRSLLHVIGTMAASLVPCPAQRPGDGGWDTSLFRFRHRPCRPFRPAVPIAARTKRDRYETMRRQANIRNRGRGPRRGGGHADRCVRVAALWE